MPMAGPNNLISQDNNDLNGMAGSKNTLHMTQSCKRLYLRNLGTFIAIYRSLELMEECGCMQSVVQESRPVHQSKTYQCRPSFRLHFRPSHGRAMSCNVTAECTSPWFSCCQFKALIEITNVVIIGWILQQLMLEVFVIRAADPTAQLIAVNILTRKCHTGCQ